MVRGRWLPRERIDAMRREKESANTPLRREALAVERLIAAERFDEAATRLEQTHREHPDAKIPAEIVLRHYAQRATTKAPHAAVRMRELNVALYPDSFSAHTDAARTYMAIGDRAAALRHLDRAVAMSPDDVVARGVLEEINLTAKAPTFDPASHYTLTVQARRGLCGDPQTLHVVVDLARGVDGTYAGTLRVVPDDADASSAMSKPEPLTGVRVGADHLWLTSAGPDLRLVVAADGVSVRGRYVGGFASNFPLAGTRSSAK
jgi:tetratricopeptide (TPR) repeat protein